MEYLIKKESGLCRNSKREVWDKTISYILCLDLSFHFYQHPLTPIRKQIKSPNFKIRIQDLTKTASKASTPGLREQKLIGSSNARYSLSNCLALNNELPASEQ